MWNYTWEAGRQLKQMSTEGASVSFKYDHNGLRVQKVVEQSWYPETTNYIYHSKLLTHASVDYTDFNEEAHQDKMHFFYDAQSCPTKVELTARCTPTFRTCRETSWESLTTPRPS